jgi:hypothetical protein
MGDPACLPPVCDRSFSEGINAMQAGIIAQAPLQAGSSWKMSTLLRCTLAGRPDIFFTLRPG